MRKGKIFSYLLAGVVVFSLLGIGCENNTRVTPNIVTPNIGTPNIENDSTTTITANTQVTFVGQVLDFQFSPLSGVRVDLLADKTYTATTDNLGNYIINVPTGKIIATPGGGNGDQVSPDAGNSITTITRTFPVIYQKGGFNP